MLAFSLNFDQLCLANLHCFVTIRDACPFPILLCPFDQDELMSGGFGQAEVSFQCTML